MKVKEEVISISDAIIDGKRVEHLGVLVLIRCEDKVAVRLMYTDENRNPKTVKLDLDRKDAVRVFCCPQKSCVGFLSLSKYPLKQISTIVHVATKDDELTCNEVDYFRATFSKFTIMEIGSKVELKTFLEKNNFKNIQNIIDAVWNPRDMKIASPLQFSRCCDKEEQDSMCCSDKIHTKYLRSYVYFIQTNRYEVDKAKGKKIIQSTTNVVKFVKSLGGDCEYLLPAALSMFLCRHACEAPGCSSFSYLRCKDCHSAHYCNVECQEKDWENHKLLCQDRKRRQRREQTVPNILRGFLQKQSSPKLMTLPAFVRNLDIRIYEAFYDSMKTKAVQSFLQLCLSSSDRFSSKCHEEMLRMLKNAGSRRLESVNELRKQFFQEYGLDLERAIFQMIQRMFPSVTLSVSIHK